QPRRADQHARSARATEQIARDGAQRQHERANEADRAERARDAGNGGEMKHNAAGEPGENEPHDLPVGDQIVTWRGVRPADGRQGAARNGQDAKLAASRKAPIVTPAETSSPDPNAAISLRSRGIA